MPEHVVVSPSYQQLRHHGERGRELVFSTERHEHISRADRGIEALESPRRFQQTFKSLTSDSMRSGERIARAPALAGAACLDMNVLMLRGTVRCQKLAAHVDDGLVVPEDAHARLGNDLGDHRGFEGSPRQHIQKLFHIGGSWH